MLQTKIISKELCAVAFDPTEITVRKRGKEFYGTEKNLAVIRNGKLYIFEDTAKEFGIEICKTNISDFKKMVVEEDASWRFII